MSEIKFSLPPSSIISVGTGVLMFFGFLTIFNALRFIQCSSWVLLQEPPEKAVVLLGTSLNRPYVRTTSGSIYCFEKSQWSECLLPPHELEPVSAPAWLNGKLQANFPNSDLLQVIRSDGFSEINYYSLLADGRLLVCSTNSSAEIGNMLHSGLFVWLLIPALAMILSVVSFFKIFIKYGQPTLSDFWGVDEDIT
jgi:hypothetical protein